LEFLSVWSPYDVAERIETGKGLFPNSELILNNQFTPMMNNEKDEKNYF
jgi:hypothetical protein